MTLLTAETAGTVSSLLDDPDRRFLLPGLDWSAYQKISEALAGRHLRLSYDRGRLEFMTISPKHGKLSRLIGRLVAALAEETGQPLASFGDMTCDRADLDRGVEPDECFYIQHEPQIRGRDELDLGVDPPPDLAVEVDLTSSSRIRLGVYSALGVPEVWRFAGDRLTILWLTSDGTFEENAISRSFPVASAAELNRFLALRSERDEGSLIREFRDWLRKQAVNQLSAVPAVRGSDATIAKTSEL